MLSAFCFPLLRSQLILNLTVCAVEVILFLLSVSGNSPKALESKSKNTLFASSVVPALEESPFRAKVVVESLLFREERIQE